MPDSQARLNSLVSHTAAEARDLAAQAHAGKLSPRAFGDHMAALLEEAHAAAVLIGRHAAGDTAPLEADDRHFALLVVDSETEFLADFVKDVRDGRYEASEDALTHRAASYAGRLVGTANEVLTRASGAEEVWEWRLGGENSCPDCPRIAAGGPYRTSELPTRPGENGTQCLQHCRCYLQRADGTRSFAVPELE